MRDWFGIKRFPDFMSNVDRAGKKAYGQGFLVAGFWRRKAGGSLFLDCFERQIHRLKPSLVRSQQRPEGNETKMSIKAFLPGSSGNDGEVVAFGFAELQYQPEQAAEDVAVPIFFLYRKQTNFNDRAAGRKV